MEKRRAVESEDYDRAKVKKQQMDEYRRLAYENLHVTQLLDSAVVWHCFPCCFCISYLLYLTLDSSQIAKRGMLPF